MTSDIRALWDFKDPAASEERFRAALAEMAGGERLEVQTQIARAQGLQGNFARGHATLDAIERDVSGRSLVCLLLERGRLLNSAGKPDEAVPHFRSAVAEAALLGETALEIDALHMLGIAAPEPEREGWTRCAIERAETSTDPVARRWLGSLLNNLGWTYHDAGEHTKALDAFERALAWHLEHGSAETIHIARWSVARCLRSLGQVERALEIQQALAAGTPADAQDPYVLDEIAECRRALGLDQS